ncbi:FeoC-like transcriptional regulator [Magnetofaba australis]|uniref:Transcriptional regulator HTH-type FeoC domain-containing protein n=1 Tax=Magnetofaba australis IT-1 TaxID=1434232 RepID=A0A1Y2K289_9PROT|nr:FeoC-like transcriptional regulator [Magnetofaba australis]OSM02150.1 hypothetical protein MAIT1_02246 [Magnetofaba australis IT-1]
MTGGSAQQQKALACAQAFLRQHGQARLSELAAELTWEQDAVRDLLAPLLASGAAERYWVSARNDQPTLPACARTEMVRWRGEAQR